MKMLAHPLTVVAHDAGAANHIFAWLSDERPTLCLTGPARALWKAHLQKKGAEQGFGLRPQPDFSKGPLLESSLAAALDGAASVITGTGWESNLEHDARRRARDLGIFSIAVIDHWTNYADRFVRNGEQVLPDEIWVIDPYAERIAQETFPTVRVVQHVNAYLEGLVAEVEARQVQAPQQGNDRVLYVLEPIRNAWGRFFDQGEFLALDYFMAQIERAPVSATAEIRLRPHPSDPPGKYDIWIAGQANSQVSLDRSESLAEALAWSNVVAGCQTYAMVIALACGRTVICTIPSWAPRCVLPHQGITHL
jgi:hypothetical protein